MAQINAHKILLMDLAETTGRFS